MNLKRYFGSLGGRLFIFLMIGAVGSASLALALADAHRRADLERVRLDRIADRMQDFFLTANSIPQPLRARLVSSGVSGLRLATGGEQAGAVDADLTERLSARIRTRAVARHANPESCAAEGATLDHDVDCWVVTTALADGTPLTLSLLSREVRSSVTGVDIIFLATLGVGLAILTFIASRMAAAPLGDLSRAARALGGDLDRLPLPERGPYEVRDAARAFNAMQAKLRQHVVERTHILASITHDLQTPLTRLRLRLEKVADPALRSRLIDDIGAMEALIREGLDFSRSNQTMEPFAPLALDSLLESLVEDAAEGGRAVALTQRCGCDVEARPSALQRCLSNLLDNALNYGGCAEVSAALEGGQVRIRIRDHGPGIPQDKLEAVFEPFVRLETSRSRATGGVGLGLTIARVLAQENDAELTLANHLEGGLEACLTLRRRLAVSAESRRTDEHRSEAAAEPSRPSFEPQA